MVALVRPAAVYLSTVLFHPNRCCLSRRSAIGISSAAVPLLASSAQPCSAATTDPPAFRTATKRTIMSHSSAIDTGYLNAADAASLDEELMSSPGFTLEQLMELAGLSVAEAVYQVLHERARMENPKILLICGPGNNGGDSLVAARHLVMFGYKHVTIVYPKRSYSRQPHYANLVQQCEDVNISVLDVMPEDWTTYDCFVDSIFGFSFQGEPRPPFDAILKQLQVAAEDPTKVVVAVDVPSGWNVNGDDTDDHHHKFMPDVLVSLTAPKLFAKHYTGRHFVGGRFLPPALAEKYQIRMPPYPGVSQVVDVTTVGKDESAAAQE